jgi:formylglycine-generating enzyme required for sulfatase activity
MIKEAIAILQEAGFDLTATEIAEILWLALHLEPSPQQPQQQSSASQQQPRTTNRQPQTPISDTPVEASSSQIQEIEEPAAQVTLPSSELNPISSNRKPEAIPIKIPAAVALRNALALGRALRPLMRKVPSPIEKILDEEATVHRIAEEKVYIPVLKPAPERWLELALVVENTSTTAIWKQTITEFQCLLKHHGAFRDVRTWGLKVSYPSHPIAHEENAQEENQVKIQLFPQNSSGGYDSTPYNPKVLIDPKRRRLTLLVSDCISPAWRNKLIHPVLELWGRNGLLTILQLLPERLWERTALSEEIAVLLSALQPGVTNSQLIAQIWDEDDIDDFNEGDSQDQTKNSSFYIPIITLEPESLLIWSRVLVAQGSIPTAGFKFSDPQNPTQPTLPIPHIAEKLQLPASELVSRFRATASGSARQLAGLMAAAPVSLSIVHLIQQTLLPESAQIHVAEVFMSGLLKRLPSSHQDIDYIEFEFVNQEVRDLLLDTVPKSKTISVLDTVSEFIALRVGLSVRDFEARLRLPSSQAHDDLETKIRPFAKLKAQTLKRLGGVYAEIAEELEVSSSIGVTTKEVQLQIFTFETVTVNHRGKIINRETNQQARYFTEKLAKGIALEMVYIPGGTFLMGAPKEEEGSRDNERPQHQVTIPPFFMGKYPVTQKQWRAVAALPQINRKLNPNPSRFEGYDLPVEKISWYDCAEFCARLSAYTKRDYRLPSESEWEYACRAGTTTPFHFGETISTEVANYNGEYTYGSGSKGEKRKQTTPVGSFHVANAFGLFDMHGNVWEWCADEYHQNYDGAPVDGSAWNSNNENDRMLRGGSWFDYPWDCRSAYRVVYSPDGWDDDRGFRVVVSG